MTAEASPSRQAPPQLGPQKPVAPAPPEPSAPLLVPFCFWLPRSDAACPGGGSTAPSNQRRQPPDPAALSGGITQHLAGLGWGGAAPLRWAITAVDPAKGLQLEGVAIGFAPLVASQAAQQEPR